jgi:anti-anti-sigma factor
MKKELTPNDRICSYALIRDVEDDVGYVRVLGELDLSAAAELEASLGLVAESCGLLRLDLTACRYFDSTIIGVMIRALKRWKERFAIIIPPEHLMRRTLSVAGVLATLPIHPDEAALDSWRRVPQIM